MHGLCLEGGSRWTPHLLIIWLLAATPPKGLGYFLGDTKAVLNGCKDHWTLQDRAAIPLLLQMTVCVDIRVVTPGAWVAFSYSSIHAPKPELGLEGDENAVYGWLLKVRHRFPLQLSLTHWHRLCLRRDVVQNSFILEVDGRTVAKRTVIAHAIPRSGSLWLGCRPRDRAPGAVLGQVELYLFRMWADVDNHGLCEDGNVIGWSAQYWGLTNPRARQRDPNLLCDHTRFRPRAKRKAGNAMGPGGQSNSHGSPLVNCNIEPLCSSTNASFWMSIDVNAKDFEKTEEDVRKLVSNAFGCHGDRKEQATCFMDFCQDDGQLQEIQVNCEVKSGIRETTCDVLLQFSRVALVDNLRCAGVSALQRGGDQGIKATLIGAMERAGRALCGDAVPSRGQFVRCSSTPHTKDICQEITQHKIKCFPIEPFGRATQSNTTQPCSIEEPCSCDCTAFCNSEKEFFAMRFHVNNDSVHVGILKYLLSKSVTRKCSTTSGPTCPEIFKHYKWLHLECNSTQTRSHSCMVILEMPEHVDSCSLNRSLQQFIDDNANITQDTPLTRLVVCGRPGLRITRSNPTSVHGGWQSDMCQTISSLLKCKTNETPAVDCPTTATPGGPSPEEGVEKPTAPPQPLNSTGLSAAQTVLHTSSPNTAETLSGSTTGRNTVFADSTAFSTAAENTEAKSTMASTTLSSVSSTQSISAAAHTDSTFNATTTSPSDTTIFNVTTVGSRRTSTIMTDKATVRPPVTTSPNHTTMFNVTTAGTTALNNVTTDYNVTQVSTFSLSNHTSMYNTTTATNGYPTIPNNHTDYNATTPNSSINNVTITTINTTISTFASSPNHRVTDKVTTAANYATEYNVTTVDTSTAAPNHTMELNVATPANNYTAKYNVTTTAKNYTAKYNVTTTANNYTAKYNVTTPANNYTAKYNVTTPADNYTTDYNVTTTTVGNNINLLNSTITTGNATVRTSTASPTHAMIHNLSTVTENYTAASKNDIVENNATTAVNGEHHSSSVTSNATISAFKSVTPTANNYTTEHNESTAAKAEMNTVTPSPNYTMANNITTISNNDTIQKNITTATVSPNTTAVTVSPMGETQQNTTTLHPLSSTRSSTVDNTSPFLTTNTANSTVASVKNQTGSDTRARVTDYNAATDETNSTTTLASTTSAKSATGTNSTTTAETNESQKAQKEQAIALLEQTRDASQLNSSQVAQLTEQLEKLLDGPSVSQAVGQTAINIISNLMEADSEALSASANRLVRLVDDLGFKVVVAGNSEILSSNSLFLAVRTVDGTNFQETTVDILKIDNVQLGAFGRSTLSGSVLGSILLPSSLTVGLSPEQQQQASRTQFTYYTKPALFQDSTLDKETIVSPVLGSSVANLSISNLSENIEFTIRNINPVHANYTASCSFWDFTLNSGRGGWSSAGCFLVNATAEDTTCSCNHLTSFAILMDLSREGVSDHQQAQILTFITYVGCGISAIFLSVTVLTYLSFEKLLRDIPAKILVQLCTSLLLLNLVFLLDGWLALYPAVGLCISTAFFLHYFLLTSFTWAGLEALHMYLSVIKVFTPYLSRYMLRFSIMGWGIPLGVVIIVISVDKDNYGLVTYANYTDGTSGDFCWLRNSTAFYVGVVAYFLLVFALSLLVFIMVMVQLARIKRQNPQNQSPNRGVLTDLRSIAGLIILLGLTWGFALFAWGPLYLPFVYLFTIFNSLQGFLVFVFHCAVKENVRKQWRTYLCCGRLRLAENSEWSRTATHTNRNMSAATANTSARHLNSRSSSVISAGTNSSGSVFVDSGISDSCGSDVILNEIHRRTLTS